MGAGALWPEHVVIYGFLVHLVLAPQYSLFDKLTRMWIAYNKKHPSST